MPSVLLDTSSLISLALTQQKSGRSRPQIDDFKVSTGVDEAIEALVLYDDILVDGPSVARNNATYPEMEPFVSVCRQIATGDGEEEAIYRGATAAFIDRIVQVANPLDDLFDCPLEQWMGAETGVPIYYPSTNWLDVEARLGGEAARMAAMIRVKSGIDAPSSAVVCTQLLRTLYYSRLQQDYQADLILHPLKGAYYEPSDGVRTGNTILNLFDETVKRAFYERKAKWLGRPEVSFKVPLLTSYVVNTSRSWTDLPATIIELRNSSQARRFREGLSVFIAAADGHDNQKMDTIISQLSTAAEDWSKDINVKGLTKAVRVTVPLINMSSELNVPDKKIGAATPSEKMLVFIHTLLSRS